MDAKELVQVKLSVEKKKLAREMGESIASRTSSLLAQTVGHSVLLYKEATPPGKITLSLRQMIAELAADEEDDEYNTSTK